MFSANVFKNLDKEFREILANFVYDKLSKKSKIELIKIVECQIYQLSLLKNMAEIIK